MTKKRQKQRAAMSPEELEAHRAKKRAYYREYRRKWREENRDREQEMQRKIKRRAYVRDPVKHRERAAAARYGITVSEYRELLARANGHCEACGVPTDKLQIDHCHTGGHIRGVLCGHCNSALGYAKDDIRRLELLIEYLKRAA